MKCRMVFSVVSLVAVILILASCGGGSSPATTAIAYVAHSQSHSLSVIKIPADKTVASIEIGNSSVGDLNLTPSYPAGVAVTPNGSLAYVTDAVTSVWVVDTGSKSVIAKIAAGSDPDEIAITPDGKTAYVTSITCGLLLCSGPDNPPQLASVEVIDTASNSLTATITIGNLPTAQTPGVLLSGIAISPDGTRAYVSNGQGNQIWAIDTSSNQVVATIPTAVLGFVGVSISPDGSRLYAASVGNPSVVDVIDTKTDDVVTSIPLPSSEPPTQIRVTPDGSHAYVTGDRGHLWVIDTTTSATVATVAVSFDNWLQDIAFAADGSRAYVTCGNTNAIYVLDTTTYSLVGRIASSYPGGLAIARPT
jgi:YVTN family beta-propeller protein